jgi:hypothetical protein
MHVRSAYFDLSQMFLRRAMVWLYEHETHPGHVWIDGPDFTAKSNSLVRMWSL